MKDEKKEIKIADLFGGVGGFRLGIERAINSSCVFYSEIDKFSVQTYNKNFKENHKPTDITNIRAEDIPNFDMLCGGFPCQAFSIAGKRGGFQDTRGTLFFEIARIIKAKRPKIVFLENVKGLLNHEKGQTFSIIIQTISELGYNVQWMVLNSKFFGVPQNRERVFIIGSIRGECKPEILSFRYTGEKYNEKQLYGKKTSKPSKCSQDSQNRGGQSTNKLRINAATKKGYSEAVAGDGIRLEYPQSKTARGRVIKGNSNTLKSGTEGVVTTDMKIRKLTPIECERLQGFPDNWTEGVSDTQRYKQMGNAVTVNVIEAIAGKLI